MGDPKAPAEPGRARSSIVHLIGHVGVGKYTVGTELARRAAASGSRFVLVDNHLTANVVFSVLPVDDGNSQEIPPAAWERVFEIRRVLLRTIEQLSPPDWSFVFTNVALQDHPVNSNSVQLLRDLAAARHSLYVPVRLQCERAEHLRRVELPERSERNKLRDPDRVARQANECELVRPDDPTLLDLDITQLRASDAATTILEHVQRCLDEPAARAGGPRPTST